MKEFLAKPSFLGTHGTPGADLSYLFAVFFTALFLVGWHKARKHEGNFHHNLTLWGMVTMLVYFSGYYLARGLGVLALEGKEGFGGPDWIYNYIFTPTLTIHILLVTFGIVIAIYMIILGFRASVKQNGNRILKNEEIKINSRNFLLTLAVSFGLFLLLAFVRCNSFGCYIVYIVGFLIVFLVLLFEKVIEKFLPDGAKRHRLLGRLTMVMYVVILMTSTLTYILLYIAYPPKIG